VGVALNSITKASWRGRGERNILEVKQEVGGREGGKKEVN
jgi:hypothetical protein